MIIKNFDSLATSPIRRDGLVIADAALAAIDTRRVIDANLSVDGRTVTVADYRFELKPGAKLLVVGVGKCAGDAAAAIEAKLGDLITGGVVITMQPVQLQRIRILQGTHPLPSEQNIAATRHIIELLHGLSSDDVVLMVISGGGSTLLCQPASHTCEQEIRLIERLFKAGATIQQINTIRKHISTARGGYLAQYAYPAQVVGLVFSDVVGNDLAYIASGPTVKDESTQADAMALLEQLGLTGTVPPGAVIETPKDDRYFAAVHNLLLVSNDLALQAMSESARQLGYNPRLVSDQLRGEAETVGRAIAAELSRAPARAALLYGGETTVTIHGSGQGGRNQHLALAALDTVAPGQLIISLASDGVDNGDHAGALCDTLVKDKALKLDLDRSMYLTNSDSYNFYNSTGDYIVTGPTAANVADLVIAVNE